MSTSTESEVAEFGPAEDADLYELFEAVCDGRPRVTEEQMDQIVSLRQRYDAAWDTQTDSLDAQVADTTPVTVTLPRGALVAAGVGASRLYFHWLEQGNYGPALQAFETAVLIGEALYA